MVWRYPPAENDFLGLLQITVSRSTFFTGSARDAAGELLPAGGRVQRGRAEQHSPARSKSRDAAGIPAYEPHGKQ